MLWTITQKSIFGFDSEIIWSWWRGSTGHGKVQFLERILFLQAHGACLKRACCIEAGRGSWLCNGLQQSRIGQGRAKIAKVAKCSRAKIQKLTNAKNAVCNGLKQSRIAQGAKARQGTAPKMHPQMHDLTALGGKDLFHCWSYPTSKDITFNLNFKLCRQQSKQMLMVKFGAKIRLV